MSISSEVGTVSVTLPEVQSSSNTACRNMVKSYDKCHFELYDTSMCAAEILHRTW